MIFFIGVFLGAIVVLLAFWLWQRAEQRKFLDTLEMALFLVSIPRTSPGEKAPDLSQELNRFEQLLSNLSSLQKPFAFEVAVPHVGEEIHFYIALPRSSSEVASKQIQAIWHGAVVTPAKDDYNIFNAYGAHTGAYLAQTQHFALPLRTYRELNTDSFSAILGGFTKVNEVGEGASFQLIVRPASSDPKNTVYKLIESLKQGKVLEDLLKNPLTDLKQFKRSLNPETPEQIAEREKNKIIDEEAVKILSEKISKPLFYVNARILASAATPFQANDILDGLIAGLQQFSAPRRNELKVVKVRQMQHLSHQFIFREFDSKNTMLLNSEEVASFYHFPTAFTETPRVKWLKSKTSPPPVNLPASGTLIGYTDFGDAKHPVRITDADRMRHVYVIGQTGVGKSTLLGNMIIEDIEQGKGVAIIDPHGDLVKKALGHIPASRSEDVVYFDPADIWKPLGLNMLDFNYDRPEEKTFIVNEMQGIFNKLFSQETMGPMFEQYMRNALLLLMEDMVNEPATLVEVPRVFTDPEYRKRKLMRIHNPVVVDFWEKEAVKAGGEASLANMTPYITSKFNNFISNDYLRPIIGQEKSAFNFREAMDAGKIILVNLSKGKIGDINAGLLGMIFTGKILMAALSRVDTPESERREFNLYIDEFQNFTTDSISSILSEARKYKLSLTIAHQFIAQLTEPIRDAVFGNVGSEIVFRVGVQDADFLVKQFEPTFNQNDLMNIDNLHAYAKILIEGQTSKPFNIALDRRSFSSGDLDRAEKIRELSRLKYGKDRAEIEAGIHERLRG